MREPLPSSHLSGTRLRFCARAYTPICTGNYAIGTNAALPPMGGFAHTYSRTSVFDFLKRTGLAYLTAEGYASLNSREETLGSGRTFQRFCRRL